MRTDWKEGKLAIETPEVFYDLFDCGGPVGLGLWLAGRDKIEAINLANEGDQSVKINVEGAIQKYEQAIDLDPTNHRILWKLANAYEKKEDWDKMASTLSRAVQVAPDFANYWGSARPRADHASTGRQSRSVQAGSRAVEEVHREGCEFRRLLQRARRDLPVD